MDKEKHFSTYINNICNTFKISSIETIVSFSSKKHNYLIDFDYIQRLETFENGLFQVNLFFQETYYDGLYTKLYLQLTHEAYTYCFRIKKNPYENLVHVFEMELTEVIVKSGERLIVNDFNFGSIKLFPIERIEFVSHKLRKFLVEYYNIPSSAILFDYGLRQLISDSDGEYSLYFYRSDYETRKSEDMWLNQYDDNE